MGDIIDYILDGSRNNQLKQQTAIMQQQLYYGQYNQQAFIQQQQYYEQQLQYHKNYIKQLQDEVDELKSKLEDKAKD